LTIAEPHTLKDKGWEQGGPTFLGVSMASFEGAHFCRSFLFLCFFLFLEVLIPLESEKKISCPRLGLQEHMK